MAVVCSVVMWFASSLIGLGDVQVHAEISATHCSQEADGVTEDQCSYDGPQHVKVGLSSSRTERVWLVAFRN